MVASLESLPVSLQHNEWMLSYDNNSTRKVESDGAWYLKCCIVDPYRNEYNQGYQTKATDRELSKIYKISDIIQRETMTMKLDHLDPKELVNSEQWRKLCSRRFIITFCFGRSAIGLLNLNTTPTLSICLQNKFTHQVLNTMGCEDDLVWFVLENEWACQGAKERYVVVEYVRGEESRRAVLNGLSALTQCKALDRITVRKLIGPNRKLITEAPMSGAPRVAMFVPSRPSMQDLYDRMGNIEIRQGVVERMVYRESYQWDRYDGVFEHMAIVYDIPLQGLITYLGRIKSSTSSSNRVQDRLKESMCDDSIFSRV
nr:hypothetical protein [Tanacetum cinerariifolium]